MTLLDSRKIGGSNVSETRTRRTWWRVLGWWLSIAGGLAVSAQTEDELSQDAVVMMSPFTVRAETMSQYEFSVANVKFEDWRKLISPNFIVYTDAEASELRPMIEKMEMLFMATPVMVGRRPLAHAPITVVMPSLSSEWKKIHSKGKIRYKGKVKWKVGASSFDELAYVAVMEYDWQYSGVELLYSTTAGLNFELLGLNGAFPIMRGLAYYFETAEVVDGALNIGGASRRLAPLRNEEWFDWDHFFAIRPTSPEFVGNSNKLYRFDAQATLFVHYMLMQDDPQVKEQFWEWNALLHTGYKPSETLFQSVFGLRWKELEKATKSHLIKKTFTTRPFRFPPESMDFVVTEFEVKAPEMRELFVLAQINNQEVEESVAALNSLLKKGLKTESLRPMLAGACILWERPESALKVLQEMIATGKQFPEVYAMAAELLLKSQWNEGMPSAELLDEVRSLLTMALEGEPLLPTAIDGMTQVLAMGPTVTPEQVEEIERYCMHFQGNGATDRSLLALALASWRIGDEARAKRVCDLLAESSLTKRSSRMLAQRMDQAIKEGESPEQWLEDLNRGNGSAEKINP